MNLIEKLRQKLGYPPFSKIDPNTQQFVTHAKPESRQILGQSVITAVLTAIYRYSHTEEGFSYLLNRDINIPWSVMLFGDESERVTASIAKFSGENEAVVNGSIEEAGNEVMKISSADLGGKFNHENFGNYISSIRKELFVYLPPQLHLGEKLHDDSLDDRTNKMEGPVSGLMHQIEKMFSKPQGPDRSDNF